MSNASIEQEIGQDYSEMSEEIAIEDKGLNINFDWLRTPTGEGSIDNYLDHPLNFNNSQALARILRGLTGILGSLDLAIIDIAVGLLEFIKPKKAQLNA